MNKPFACETPDDHCAHAGLLVLRLGLGITFLFVHGAPKLLGGTESWESLGKAMAFFGVTFAPAVWGFLAGAVEALGGLLLILGVWVRPAAAFLLVVMIVAISFHVQKEMSVMHPLEMGIVFLALLVGGGGRYGLCALFGEQSTKPAGAQAAGKPAGEEAAGAES